MSLSVADEKNLLINIHNLNKTIKDLRNGVSRIDWTSKEFKSRQMKCVIEYSSNFCQAYGQYQLGKTGTFE
ncbi:Beta-mannosyltransferase 6 [Candida tropicalis]